MRQVKVYALDNNGQRLKDNSGNPIPKIFDDNMWENIKRFPSPKFEFIGYIDAQPSVDSSKVKAIKIEPKSAEPKENLNESRPVEEKNEPSQDYAYLKDLSVAKLKNQIDSLTEEELNYLVENDSRTTAVNLAKKQLEK